MNQETKDELLSLMTKLSPADKAAVIQKFESITETLEKTEASLQVKQRQTDRLVQIVNGVLAENKAFTDALRAAGVTVEPMGLSLPPDVREAEEVKSDETVSELLAKEADGLRARVDELEFHKVSDLELKALKQTLAYCKEQENKSQAGYFSWGWAGTTLTNLVQRLETKP